MPIRKTEGATVITGSAIPLVQLIAVKHAIRLETLGLKHSGGSVRKRWAVALGLKPTAKADAVLERIEERIAATHAAIALELAAAQG